jgi:hypothetical protein
MICFLSSGYLLILKSRFPYLPQALITAVSRKYTFNYVRISKIEVHHIVKNLMKAKLDSIHAEAIAKEIKKSTDEFSSNKMINIKLDRVIPHVEAKLYKIKAEILKWIIGVSVLQVCFNFALNTWGI